MIIAVTHEELHNHSGKHISWCKIILFDKIKLDINQPTAQFNQYRSD